MPTSLDSPRRLLASAASALWRRAQVMQPTPREKQAALHLQQARELLQEPRASAEPGLHVEDRRA